MSIYRTASICVLALCFGIVGCSKPKPTILDNKKAMAALGAHPQISAAAMNTALAPLRASALPRRPLKLAQMLTDSMAVDPTGAFTFNLRTLTPYSCVVVGPGVTRCQTTFGKVGSDGLAGYLDVIIRDQAVAFDTEFANVAKTVKVQPGQTPQTFQGPIEIKYGNGGTRSFNSECLQAMGDPNSSIQCLMLFDTRTELVAGAAPQGGSNITVDQGKPTDPVAMALVTSILQLGAEQLAGLYNVSQSANGDYKTADLNIKDGAVKYTRAGWYWTNYDSSSLSAGPYADEASCKSDQSRVSDSIAAQGASISQVPMFCTNFRLAPQ
jgi:hypothetical protein